MLSYSEACGILVPKLRIEPVFPELQGGFFFFFFSFSWWILSYIEMKQPWVYMCSPSRSPLPPLSRVDSLTTGPPGKSLDLGFNPSLLLCNDKVTEE